MITVTIKCYIFSVTRVGFVLTAVSSGTKFFAKFEVFPSVSRVRSTDSRYFSVVRFGFSSRSVCPRPRTVSARRESLGHATAPCTAAAQNGRVTPAPASPLRGRTLTPLHQPAPPLRPIPAPRPGGGDRISYGVHVRIYVPRGARRRSGGA